MKLVVHERMELVEGYGSYRSRMVTVRENMTVGCVMAAAGWCLVTVLVWALCGWHWGVLTLCLAVGMVSVALAARGTLEVRTPVTATALWWVYIGCAWECYNDISLGWVLSLRKGKEYIELPVAGDKTDIIGIGFNGAAFLKEV